MAFLPSLARPVIRRVTGLGRMVYTLTTPSRRRCLLTEIALWQAIMDIRCCSGPKFYNQTTFVPRRGEDENQHKDVLSPDSLSEQQTDSYSLETTKEFLLPSQQQRYKSDLLLTKIKQCEHPSHALELFRRHSEVMDTKHNLALIERFSEIVATDKQRERLLEEEDFKTFCRHLFVQCRHMVVQDCIPILKSLSLLQVQSTSKLTQGILQMIKSQINDLDLKQLIFLEFLLRKATLTPLSDALLTAIPILISNRLTSPEELTRLSFTELSQVFSLCCSKGVKGAGVILQEMYRRGSVRTTPLAMSLVWTLTGLSSPNMQMKYLTKDEQLTKEVIQKECLEILARDMDSLTAQEVESTLSKLNVGYNLKDRSCYNERFLNSVASYCCKHTLSFEKTGHTIMKMISMNYISDDLIRYAANLLVVRPEEAVESRIAPLPIISSITASSLVKEEMHEALDILMTHRSIKLDSDYYKMPLGSLAIDLISVEYYHPLLMDILTSPDTLSLYLSRYQRNNAYHRRLLEINIGLETFFQSSVKIPDMFLESGRAIMADLPPSSSSLKAMLSLIIEDPSILVSGVLTDAGTYIDHLVVLDPKGVPIRLRNPDDPLKKNTTISSLDLPPDATKLAILDIGSGSVFRPTNVLKGALRLRVKVLEAGGFKVLPILQSVIFQHHEEEKILYVKRELCEAGLNLS